LAGACLIRGALSDWCCCIEVERESAVALKPVVLIGLVLALAGPAAALSAPHPVRHIQRHPVRVRHVRLRRHRLAGHMSADMVTADARPSRGASPPPTGDDDHIGPVRGGTVHYDHGPAGLNDDVGTVRLVHHF
jgi:hypothetical protein